MSALDTLTDAKLETLKAQLQRARESLKRVAREKRAARSREVLKARLSCLPLPAATEGGER